MPIFELSNGEWRDVSDSHAAAYAKNHPDAKVIVETPEKYLRYSSYEKYLRRNDPKSADTTGAQPQAQQPAPQPVNTAPADTAGTAPVQKPADTAQTQPTEAASQEPATERLYPTPFQVLAATSRKPETDENGNVTFRSNEWDVKASMSDKQLAEDAGRGADRVKDTVEAFDRKADNVREYNAAKTIGPAESVYTDAAGVNHRTWIAPNGKRYADRRDAEYETAMFMRPAPDMSVSGQIASIEKKRDYITRKRDARVRELSNTVLGQIDEGLSAGGLKGMLRSNAAASNISETINNDEQVHAYDVAIKQYDEAIQQLRRQQRRDRGQRNFGKFWQVAGEEAGQRDNYGFTGGILKAVDAITRLNADSYKGREWAAGENADAYRIMKEGIAANQEIQQTYGQNANAAERWGAQLGQMPAFILDFLETFGGFSEMKLAGRVTEKVAEKVFTKGVEEEMAELGVKAYMKKYGFKGALREGGDFMIKAVGTTADEIIRGNMMTNTVQLGKTAASAIDYKLGDVVQNPDGSLSFENPKTWSQAVWLAEADQTIENFSEMFGTHIDPLTRKAFSKVFGLGRLSRVMAGANVSNARKVASTIGRGLEKAGVSDYIGEVLEEYDAQAWKSLLNLDTAYQQNPDGTRTNLFLTKEFHGDIWGGLFFSIGLTTAFKYTAAGVAAGFREKPAPSPNGALVVSDYTRFKHLVEVAAQRAGTMFGDGWQQMQEIIDNTPNDAMGKFAEQIVNAKDLSESERNAIMSYIAYLLVFRAFNMRTMSYGTPADEQSGEASDATSSGQTGEPQYEGEPGQPGGGQDQFSPQSDQESPGQTTVDGQMGRGYMNGYNAVTEQEMNDINNAYRHHRQQISSILGDEAADMSDEDLLDALAECYGRAKNAPDDMTAKLMLKNAGIIADYLNARSVYTGMMQGVRDRIDLEVAQSDALVDAQTNQQTGQIQTATTRMGDAVHVVSGNLALREDGSIDVQNSDESIIIRRADGSMEMVSPDYLASADAPVDTQTVKAQAAEQIRQQHAQQAADIIDGTVTSFNPGDTYTLTDDQGNPTQITLTADQNGNVVNPDGTINAVDQNGQPMRLTKEMIQQAADRQNMARVQQKEDERQQQIAGLLPPHTEETAPVGQVRETPQRPQSALDQIKRDGDGNYQFESTPSPDVAWDGIVESLNGNIDDAQTLADNMVKTMEKALKDAQNTKLTNTSDPNKMIVALNARQKATAQIQQSLDFWRQVAGTRQRRADAAAAAQAEAEAKRKAEEEKARKEAEARAQAAAEATRKALEEERQRQEREKGSIADIPDVAYDNPKDARTRGFRRVDGHKVDRQEPLSGPEGKEVQIKFADKETVKGRVKIIEADQLQPSHIQGNRNPLFFIDEAQPKDRRDVESTVRAQKIAANVRPEEITGSVTAYSGAPVVNARGEVIQGNNRSDALKWLWSDPNTRDQAKKYREYLKEHAAEFGLTPEQIDSVKNPVLVNMVDVDDDTAVRLGQYTSSDTESGGIERIKPKNTLQKMGDDIGNFIDVLMRSDNDDMTFAQLIDENGYEALKWLNQRGYITPTQHRSALGPRGAITDEAKNDLRSLVFQSIFRDGSTSLEQLFNNLPASAQKAILATAYRDWQSPKSESMLPEIQASIEAYNLAMQDPDFAGAKSIEDALNGIGQWRVQFAFDDVTGDSYLPAEKFSNFATYLTAMYKGCTQKLIRGKLNRIFDLIQGTQEATVFETPDNTPRTLAEAIKETLDIDYDGNYGSEALAKRAAGREQGRSGIEGAPRGGEQGTSETRETERPGGSEGVRGQSGEEGKAEVETPADEGPGLFGAEEEQSSPVQRVGQTAQEAEIAPVGNGSFGPIYDQFKGKAKEAIAFLMKKKDGEAIGALHHKDIGDIDLVWGKEGTGSSDGYGLAKLVKYHPEVLDNLQEILDDMHVTLRSANRVQLESDTHQAGVRLTWDNQKKTWLLTAFEKKKNSVPDNTTDTGETREGERNDTATPQNTVSADKVTEKSETSNSNSTYSIAPYDYTKKNGDVLHMYKVDFGRELTPEEKSALKPILSETRGWYDRNAGAYLMRSEEDARRLGDALKPAETTTEVEKTETKPATETNGTESILETADRIAEEERRKRNTEKGLPEGAKKMEKSVKLKEGDTVYIPVKSLGTDSKIEGSEYRSYTVAEVRKDGFNVLRRDGAEDTTILNVGLAVMGSYYVRGGQETQNNAATKETKLPESSKSREKYNGEKLEKGDSVFINDVEYRIADARQGKHGREYTLEAIRPEEVENEPETFNGTFDEQELRRIADGGPDVEFIRRSKAETERKANDTKEKPTEKKGAEKSESEEKSVSSREKGNEAVENPNRELTKEEIDAIDDPAIDKYAKTCAKAYLDGVDTPMNATAYQIIKDYVRSISRNRTGDSQHADTPLVGGAADETAGGAGRQGGVEGGRLDRGDGNEGVSGDAGRGEVREDGVAQPSRGGGHRGVSGRASGAHEGSHSSVQSGPGGELRGDGSTVRPDGEGHKGGKRVSGKDAEGREKAGSGKDPWDDLINDALAGMKDILKNPLKMPDGEGKLYSSIPFITELGVNGLRFVGYGCQLGYALVRKGLYHLREWSKAARQHLYALLKDEAKLTDEDIDRFIKELWNTSFEWEGRTQLVCEWAKEMELEELRRIMRLSIEDKIKLQKEAEKVETIIGDIDNIRESLPFLLPAQHEDVLKAETQFFDESHSDREHGYGKGIMYTNATGTGKTFTGLGIIKRFLKTGKKRVLIITAQDKKIKDWIRDAEKMGIKATALENTTSKGEGVVVTQYANIRQNYELLKDEFDLIIVDESHKVMENQTGDLTNTATFFHMLANRDTEQAITRVLQNSPLWTEERRTAAEIKDLNKLLADAEKEAKKRPLSLDTVKRLIEAGGGTNASTAIKNIKDAVKAKGDRITQIKKEQEQAVKDALVDPARRAEAEKAVARTKTVFLSATPFNTPSSLDYAESYIFSYPEETNADGSPKTRDERKGNFLMDNFPSSHVRSKNGEVRRLQDASIDDAAAASAEEVAFSDRLQNELQTMSGRELDSEYDYSRTFPKLDFPGTNGAVIASQFNAAIAGLTSGEYQPLAVHFNDILKDYSKQTAFFEIVKTPAVIERAREHLAQGRKVVIFHRRKATNQDIQCLFDQGLRKAMGGGDDIQVLAAKFMKEFAALLDWEQGLDYSFPQEQVMNAFATAAEKAAYKKAVEDWQMRGRKGARPSFKAAKVGVFNGDETTTNRDKVVEAFNKDDSGMDVLVIQVASGKEGISLHDTTGKMQRAMLVMSLPQSPVEFIQAEGRIYRVGNKSNAIFEYPLIGLDLEKQAFAYKINGRSQTTENLALGSRSRGLRQSISRAALGSHAIPVTANMGTGGKALDDAASQGRTDYDDAIANYDTWKDRPQEGDEWHADIPDPIGYKIAEWMGLENGETAFVPDAGRLGTVARYVPGNGRLVATEEDISKHGDLALLLSGGGRRIDNVRVLPEKGEDYELKPNERTYGGVYRGDAVFVRGLAAARRAYAALDDCGRAVILVNDAEKRELEREYQGMVDAGTARKAAEITLPEGVMPGGKRSHVLVYDFRKGYRATFKTEMKPTVADLSKLTDRKALFDELRDLAVPKREIDRAARMRRSAEKYAKRFEKSDIVQKRKSYASGKMEAQVFNWASEFSVYFTDLGVPLPRVNSTFDRNTPSMYGGFELSYEAIAAGNMQYMSDLADIWIRLGKWLKGEDTGWRNRSIIVRNGKRDAAVDAIKNLRGLIADVLDRNEMQLKNLAEGRAENSVSGVLDMDGLRQAYDALNSGNVELDALADRVFRAASNIDGLEIKVVPQAQLGSARTVAMYTIRGGRSAVWLGDQSFNSIRISDASKAQTIVHELIHAVTTYYLELYDRGMTDWMSRDQKQACKDINDVYNVVNNDPEVRGVLQRTSADANSEYGLTNTHELMAELVEPDMRKALKGRNLWRQTINGMEMLLGMQIPGVEAVKTNTYEILDRALDTLMEGFNKQAYNALVASTGVGHADIRHDMRRNDTGGGDRTGESENGPVELPDGYIRRGDVEYNPTTKRVRNYAVNGRRSNLSDDLQKLVDSEKFRKWAGEWKLAGLRKYLLGKNYAAVLTSPEFFNVTAEELPAKVQEYYMKNYGGKAHRNDIGFAHLNNRNYIWSDIFHLKDYYGGYVPIEDATAFAAVPDIITNGRLIDIKRKWKGQNYDSFIIAAPVSIINQDYIGLVILHNEKIDFVLYLHQLRPKKNSSTGVEGSAHQNYANFKSSPVTSTDTPWKNNAKLLEKITDPKNISSVIVDSNGEPLLLYLEDPRDTGHSSSMKFYTSVGWNEGGRSFVKMDSPMIVEARGADYDSIVFNKQERSVEQIAKYAKGKGRDGLIIKNVVIDESEGPTTVYVPFTSQQVFDVPETLARGADISRDESSLPSHALRRSMTETARSMADQLHLGNVEIVTDTSSLSEDQMNSRGLYDPKTGKITIVVPNHEDSEDVAKTVLHEAVAHYGLRQMFGEDFSKFLRDVFENAPLDVRRQIAEATSKNGWNIGHATEEYLASLAEDTNFRKAGSLWNRIKAFFCKMLRKIGITGKRLYDNELRYILWKSYQNLRGRKGIVDQANDVAMQSSLKVGNFDSDGILQRKRDNFPNYEKALARERYEKRVSSGWYQSVETTQDSMRGLMEAMEAIVGKKKGRHIEDIEGFENPYLGENRLSSVNEAETEAFSRLVFKPMLKEVSKLARNKTEREDLTNYMMAKHGLERNAYMAQREAEAEYKKYREEHPSGSKTLQDFVDKFRKKDYAGLTALMGRQSVDVAEADARDMVAYYEGKHDTKALWEKVNAVNKAVLSKQYECGMLSRETYEKIRDMYKWYIPLRGFDEKTAEDSYAYLGHPDSAFNAPIRTARGRKSKADDPIATIQQMAESAISQGNRNRLVKQKFLNFVMNHPSDLVSISDVWVRYDDTADRWVPVFPDLRPEDDADTVDRKMKEFEERMNRLKAEDPDRYKHGRDAAAVPYRIESKRDLKEHQVIVRRDGRDYILTINGNPRAAQALNGQTNPDTEGGKWAGALMNGVDRVNRFRSAIVTTYSPNFMTANFARDMVYVNTMVWVKERPAYALHFHKNVLECNPATMGVLLGKYLTDKLDDTKPLERSFRQFMLNGGETGYTSARTLEQHKRDVDREIRKEQWKLPASRGLGYVKEGVEFTNRAVEMCGRFAAFLTSREFGRSVDRAIWDAKEISVNFNKKGSGERFWKEAGQTRIGNIMSFTSGTGRHFYIFWNAAVQGLTNMGRQAVRHPAKFWASQAALFTLGVMAPTLFALLHGGSGGDGDDDKNGYLDLPDYTRRSSIMFPVGSYWISIPLSQEFRISYGLGELCGSLMAGQKMDSAEIAMAVMGQVSQALPLDLVEAGSGWPSLLPSAAQPLVEAARNRSWTGLPIYNGSKYVEDMPAWTKAYSNTSSTLVNLSATLNEIAGGDDATVGMKALDWNPAVIEYLLNSYLGGPMTFANQLAKTAETIAGQKDFDPQNIPMLNRVLKAGDERTEYRAVNEAFYKLDSEVAKTRRRARIYEKRDDRDVIGYAERLDFLEDSPEYERMEIYDDYAPDLRAYHQDLVDARDEGDEEAAKEIRADINATRKELLEEVAETYEDRAARRKRRRERREALREAGWRPGVNR